MKACVGCGGEVKPRSRPGGEPKKWCSKTCSGTIGRTQWQQRAGNKAKDRATDKRYYSRNTERIKARERNKYRLSVYGTTQLSPINMLKDRFRAARELGYRSGLEVACARQLEQARAPFEYEPFRIPYKVQEERAYLPDFLLPNGIVLELKGRWLTADRKRHRMLKEQYPDLEIRFVFSRPQDRISKQSKTTYARFCETLGWKYSGVPIPASWLRESPNLKSLACIARLRSTT